MVCVPLEETQSMRIACPLGQRLQGRGCIPSMMRAYANVNAIALQLIFDIDQGGRELLISTDTVR
jgi:hypothetical protein